MKKLFILILVIFAAQAHAQSTSGKTEALEALGGSGGLLLYNTYLVIGEAADAYSKEVYSASEVETIVQEQIGGIETVQKMYDALLATKFMTDPNDRKFLVELNDGFTLVLDEGRALITYVNSGSDTDALAYDQSRQTAWAEVERLLGLDEE